jgi:hypothetical protein
VVGAGFVSTESGAAGASRAVVGAGFVSTERSAAGARRAVVGARFAQADVELHQFREELHWSIIDRLHQTPET